LQDFWQYDANICYISRVMVNFVLRFPHLHYHGNKGRFFKFQ